MHLACQKPGTAIQLPAEAIPAATTLAARRRVAGAIRAVVSGLLGRIVWCGQRGAAPGAAPTQPAVTAGPPTGLVVPVSRYRAALIAQLLVQLGVVTAISRRTVARWLKADRLKPWRVRSWITPKNLANFLERACPILDLYERVAAGQLASGEVVFSLDEKTSIQAREHATYKPTTPGEPAHLEHTYKRRGAVQLLAALDVAKGVVHAVITRHKGFQEFSAFVVDLLHATVREGANHIHLIADDGSLHRPKILAGWLAAHFPQIRVEVHWLPVRSSWLNQIEIFFSILQQQALTPNNFSSVAQLAQRILDFVAYRNLTPTPINWTYTSRNLQYKYHRDPQEVPLAA